MADDEYVLRELFDAGLKASLPDGKFDGILPEPPAGRTIVLGAGKAAARMAADFERSWMKAGRTCEGLVVTRYGHGVDTQTIEVREAAHPVPDQAGVDAAQQIMARAEVAGSDDLVVVLISGGASALLSLPAQGILLSDKQAITSALLKSGAPIREINLVRRALSAIKGGRLAAKIAPARMVTYLISDIPGDRPEDIGSGPTLPQQCEMESASDILEKYGIAISPEIQAALQRNRLRNTVQGGAVHMLATPMMALKAAATRARELGFSPLILGDAIEGEASEVGRVMAGIALSASRHGLPVQRPCVLISGGETTVTQRGNGRGGRNSEFLLSLALALEGARGISALACDTDGIDGCGDNAGAWFDDQFSASASHAGVNLSSLLANNDAYTAFQQLNRLIVTGPTRTNVNDFRCIVIR